MRAQGKRFQLVIDLAGTEWIVKAPDGQETFRSEKEAEFCAEKLKSKTFKNTMRGYTIKPSK